MVAAKILVVRTGFDHFYDMQGRVPAAAIVDGASAHHYYFMTMFIDTYAR